MTTRWERIAIEGAGDDYATRYADGFRARAERGEDIHGEASFVVDLVPPPARVLDAGCGTGRITVRLAELGYDAVGVDVDRTMLAVAEHESPELDWRHGDLASFDLEQTFDLVLLAGNIIPLLEPGTLRDVAGRLAHHLAPGGVIVCGFGLDAAHLPGDCPPTDLGEVDAAFGAHDLAGVDRYSTWAGDPFEPGGGYAVTVYAEPRP